ncbi:hypothetical protein [Parasediminibacterium sp. JCM 36343]|uniref:hypothetical protein n=1 Tax=Parasediminibacterium sp. JCM 36343 TaxID=3374279 RepID=UPI00397C057F
MKKITFLLVCLVFGIQLSWAGFPIGKGRSVIIPGYNYYHANGYWDGKRAYSDYPTGNFSSHYFSIYGGYGLSRRWNFLYSLPFVVQVDNNTQGNKKRLTTAGFGDAMVGLSYFFNDFDANNHVSLTGLLYFPLYSNPLKPNPIIGFQSLAGELKLGFSGSATGSLRNPYYDIEFGVRQYFNTEGPFQVFANITGGVPLSDDWKVSGTISGINSLSSAISSTQVFYNYNKDFDYVRIAANAGKVINDNVSIWGGIYTDITGRSVGRGSGLSLSAVIKF